MANVGGWLVGLFIGLGGVGFVAHLAISHSRESVKNLIIKIAEKYPALKKFLQEHGPEIVAEFQEIEKGVEDAVQKETPEAPPRNTA